MPTRRTRRANGVIVAAALVLAACVENPTPTPTNPSAQCEQIAAACQGYDGGSDLAQACLEMAKDPSTSVATCYMQAGECLAACSAWVASADACRTDASCD